MQWVTVLTEQLPELLQPGVILVTVTRALLSGRVLVGYAFLFLE